MQEPTSLPPSVEVRQLASEALGAALLELEAGRVDQAVALYRAVLELQPGHAEAHYRLALLDRQAGRLADAIAHHAAALQASPEEEAYWLGYLDALVDARQFASAAELLALGRGHGLQGPAVEAIAARIAAEGAPPAADIDAAARLFAAGRLFEAGAAARALTERYPQHPFGWKLLGGVLHAGGDLPGALQAMDAAAQYGPDDAETLSNLGLLLRKAGRAPEAEPVLARALALDAGNVHAHNHLAVTLMDLGRLHEAHASASAAVARDPAHREAGNTLAVVLQRQGRLAEAVEAYRRVLARHPDDTDAHSNMLFCMSQMDGITPADLFAEHRRFGQRLEGILGAPEPWDNPREPERRLRIGFVSGDLRNHAVASFVEPVLERLAGRPGVALYAYYTYPLHDAVSARLRGYMAGWCDCAALDDTALAQRIRADGIDILIDLAGHTAHNRLPLFARKPAPLQATWIGYPFSTGLAAMDYYLTDRYILPPGQFDHLFTEKLVHLPVSAPFQPLPDAPDVVPLPALAHGYLTFGSFNRLSKISRNVVALWSRLLRAVPDARLLVAGMPEGGGEEELMGWLAKEGIAPERVRLHPRTGMRDYLALHNEVDINLDTFPYSGGTTTLHALWMGVPTLTLAGDTAAGRQTACILEHNGLHAFVGEDADAFVGKGMAAARDLAALNEMRLSMRYRFAPTSPAFLEQVADGVEHALRLMWRRWCANQPAATLDVPLPPPRVPAPIYVTQPDLPPLADFVDSLEQIWESKFLTNGGQFHQRLEAALCAHLGVEHISLFANGTIALMTALQALGIRGEVVTTPYSFVATAHALLWNGLEPVFADIDPVSFNLDPARIEAAITARTTAIMPVHCYGNPCDVAAIERIARKHGLKVVYDAAHAFGVRRQGQSILRHGDLSVLSFHATKVFNTFEGGAIVSPDAATKRRIDQLKNFGIADEVTVVAAGINGKMNEVSAAFGLLQLDSVAASLEKRAQVASAYRRLLAGVPGIVPMAELGHEANYGYFPVMVGDTYPLGRDGLHEKLRAAGIHARRYFHPLITEFPMYRDLPSAAPANLPMATTAARQVLCLPIYPGLETRDIERIVTLIKSNERNPRK